MTDHFRLSVPVGLGDLSSAKDDGVAKHQRILLEYNDAAPTVVDSTHGLPVAGGLVARAAASWTSATGIDTAHPITLSGMATAVLTLRTTSTITGGVLIFEATDDGTNWYPIFGLRQGADLLVASYTLAANDTQYFTFGVATLTGIRVRLNPAITGTGTVSLGLSASATADPSLGIGTLARTITSTTSSVASSGSSVQLLALSATRLQAAFVNDSTAIGYVKLGQTASLTDYTVAMLPGATSSYYELPLLVGGKVYNGRIDCIWASANGFMRITQLN
jgi:hypothetical protein